MNGLKRCEFSHHRGIARWPSRTLLLLFLVGGTSRAQVVLPPTLLLPNYDRIYPGLEEALEGGAYIARVRSVTALFYNPAGIALVQRSVLSASVQGYQLTTLGGSGFQHSTPVSSFEGLPSSIGVVLGNEVIRWEKVRLGFAVAEPIHWHQNAVASTAGAPGQRVSYAVGSALDMLVPSVTVGWAAVSNLRLGAALEFPYTTISESGQLSGELTAASTSQGTIRNITAGGSTLQLRAVAGVQWEPLSWLALGMTARTPGLKLLNGGSFTYESLTNLNAGTQQIFFQDTDPRFQYRLPADIGLGTAVEFWRLRFEIDLRWHTGTHEYPLFSSEKTARLVDTTSGAPVASEIPFPSITYRARPVWNWSFGAHLMLSPAVSLSGGMYLDHSPVDLDTPVFRRVDLIGFRGGISFHAEKVSGSLGLGWEHGKATDDLEPADVPIAGEHAEITLDTFSVIMSVSFKF
ncbi:MAG TPA: hypothetical protein VLT82_19310 [Myxococcaceae bacterium]|nr:hypothetical protein [Myxococcaceae bacterium]